MKNYYNKHKNIIDKFDGLLLNNTVLEKGLVVAPIIAAGNTLKNAVTLSIAFVIITFFTVVLAYFVPKKLPYAFRVILYTIIASAIFIPTSILLQNILPDQIYKVGVFIPLLITNSLIVIKSESRFHKKNFGLMILDLLCHTLGFVVVICFVGFIREILGNNTLWGLPINMDFKLSGLMLPFSGFIICGLLSAALQKLRNYLREE